MSVYVPSRKFSAIFLRKKIRWNLISGRWSYSICLLDEKVRLISGSIWTPVLIWGFKMMIDEIDQEIRPSTYLLTYFLPAHALLEWLGLFVIIRNLFIIT